MIAPWPGIRRGTEAVVPSVPGFVSEIVVPSKSETLILPVRARVTTSSAAAANSAKFIRSAPLTLGTRSEREPSAFGTSTARPNRTSSRRTRAGSPLEPSKASFMEGKDLSAWITAQDTRCVKDTLDCSLAARCSLIRRRFSSASLIGDLPLRGRGRHAEARLHVLRDPQRGPAQARPLALDSRAERGRRARRRRGGCGRRRRRLLLAEALAEVPAPLVVHGGGVRAESVEQLGDVARVAAKLGRKLVGQVDLGRSGRHKERDSSSGHPGRQPAPRALIPFPGRSGTR